MTRRAPCDTDTHTMTAFMAKVPLSGSRGGSAGLPAGFMH